MKKTIPSIISTILWTSSAISSPFVVTDPIPLTLLQATHCGVFLDSLAKVVVPVIPATTTTGTYCKYDVNTLTPTLAPGDHMVAMTYLVRDPIWGDNESDKSLPLNFTKPGVPKVPGKPTLSAN